MAKWPNVPDCYGWLALDARGAWRMRDERAQHLELAGDKVIQPALLGFINRNYAADARGCWYFQNGPQRVFVNLEAAPFIARTDPGQGLLLQTGERLEPERGFMTEAGELVLEGGGICAQLDDRDLAQLMASLELDGAPVGDDALMAWLEGAPDAPGTPGALALRWRGNSAPVERIARALVADRFGFQRLPAA